jgi:T5SS/PEP-CTERM-associated repeat protein/autotransporter-associated beta strand protein
VDANLVFDAAHGLQTSTIFGSGGTLTIDQSVGNPLGVGYKSNGTLQITGGVAVNSGGGYLGYYSGSTGIALVTGAGSKWTSTSDFYVGKDGTGALTVDDGASVVVGGDIYASSSCLSGNGTISANGGVLDADLVFDNTHGLQASSTFGSGGIITITATEEHILGAGYKGSGTIKMANGFAITSSLGFSGYDPGSNGIVTVTGAGTTWKNGILNVGYRGNGTLLVEVGGLVSNDDTYIASNPNTTGSITISGMGSMLANIRYLRIGEVGNGTLDIKEGGQANNSTAYLGYHSRSIGTAAVTGQNSKWINSGELYVGNSGNGTLNIEAQGYVGSATGYLGYDSGTTGIVKVSGAGSKWTNGGKLYIGMSGSGTLQIESGGQTSNTKGYIGYNLGSSGTVSVSGPDAKWVNSDNLYVGVSGRGTLNIESQGTVENVYSYLGYNSRSTGIAKVSGTGSKWTCTMLYVGNSGTGTLSIEKGGQVESNTSYVGYGTVTISGSNSKWTNSDYLYVGQTGPGILNIGSSAESGGQVRTKTLQLGIIAGTCNLGYGGMLLAKNVSSSGSTNFNWNDGIIGNFDSNTDLTVTVRLMLAATGTHAFNIDAGRTGTISSMLCDATSGGSLVKQGDGLLILGGNNAYTGTTTIEGGQLKLTGSIASSSEIINRASFLIDGGKHSMKKITGSGTTQVLSGSLTAKSIVQDTLTIGGPANAVPEPSSLILLALSALAILAWRRKSREM